MTKELIRQESVHLTIMHWGTPAEQALYSVREVTEAKGEDTTDSEAKRDKWQEAAVLVREGLETGDFVFHPTGKWSTLAHNLLHSRVYTLFHLVATMLLMLLALIEYPGVVSEEGDFYEGYLYTRVMFPILVSIELSLLIFIALDLLMRVVWQGAGQFALHFRTVVTALVLVLLFADAIAAIGTTLSGHVHLRVLRALRPVFFIETYRMNSVRRVFRQMFQSFKPLSDVLLLILLFISFFALLAYYLFGESNYFFKTYGRSFVSMFILRTTANFPDIMMQSYHINLATPLFFITYLVFIIYILSNILLGVVYSIFKDVEKKKFKKLLLHRRDALKRAYDMLAGAEGVSFQDFLLFVQQYKPEMPDWKMLCVFNVLVTNKLSHKAPVLETPLACISLQQFYHFYEAIKLQWKKNHAIIQEKRQPYRRFLPAPFFKLSNHVYKLVSWKWFNPIMSLVVIANFALAIYYASIVPEEEVSMRFDVAQAGLPGYYIFMIVYLIELLLRIFGFGLVQFFSTFWHKLDFVVILASSVAQIVNIPVLINQTTFLQYFIIVRLLRLFRLFHLKKRFREIWVAVGLLIPQLASVLLVVLIVYYFFAIIGMETLFSKVGPECCNTSWYGIGGSYAGTFNTTDNTAFWLNNFNNLVRTYVLLFEQMIVNNWFLAMESFASQSSQPYLVRFFFMCFHFTILVVSTVVVTYIVEAVTFKILLSQEERSKVKTCRRHHPKGCTCCSEGRDGQHNIIKLDVSYQDTLRLIQELEKIQREVRAARDGIKYHNLSYFQKKIKERTDILPEREGDISVLHGKHYRTKEDLFNLMYENEITAWIANDDPKLRAEKKRSIIGFKAFLLKIKDVIDYIVE